MLAKYGDGQIKNPNSLETTVMTSKELVIAMIEKMPANATLTDIMAELYIRQKVEVGLNQLDNGESLSQEDIELRLGQWLS